MTGTARVLRCEEALRFLAAYLDGELDKRDHADVELHVQRCRSCWSRAEFERLLIERIATLGDEEVPPTLSDRVESLMSRFAAFTDNTTPEQSR